MMSALLFPPCSSCWVLVDPNATQAVANATFFRKLLGLTGVLDYLKIAFEKMVSVQATYGVMVVEKG